MSNGTKQIDFRANIEALVAMGSLLRTSEAYKTHEFKGGEAVVSEWGTEGEVTEVLNKRPSRINVHCQICGEVRNIASQDFFQVVACKEENGSKCKKIANESGLRRSNEVILAQATSPKTKRSPTKSARAALKAALELGVIDQATHDEHMAKLDAERAANLKARAVKTDDEKREELKLKLAARFGNMNFAK